MRDPYVEQLMSRPVETIAPDATLREAAATMLEHGVGAVVVVDDSNRLEGLLTTTSFVRAFEEAVSSDRAVTERMETEVVTVERSDPLREAAAAMLDHRVHHVPVVEEAEVVGMLSTQDLTAYLARFLEP